MCFSMGNTNMKPKQPSKIFKSLATWKYEQKSKFTDFTIFWRNNVLLYCEIFVTNSTCGMSISMFFSTLNTNMRSTMALDRFEGLQNDKMPRKAIFTYFLDISVLNIHTISQFFDKNYTCNLRVSMCFPMENTNMESQKSSKNFSSLDTWKYQQKSKFTDFTLFWAEITF